MPDLPELNPIVHGRLRPALAPQRSRRGGVHMAARQDRGHRRQPGRATAQAREVGYVLGEKKFVEA